MNDYQRERMRRREYEERQQQIAIDAENSRAKKRRAAILIASIVGLVAAILVIAPMRFKAIASNDLDDVEQYLTENIDESIVGADSVVEAQMSVQSYDAEQEETVVTTYEDMESEDGLDADAEAGSDGMEADADDGMEADADEGMEADADAEDEEEAEAPTESKSGGNPFMMFAESIAGSDEETVETTDKAILTKYLLVDQSFVSDGTTIDDIYANPDLAEMSIISQYSNAMPLLDAGEDSEYYVALLDTASFNNYGRVSCVDFAWTNTNGEVITDIIYDKDTGIAYVPKFLFESYDSEHVDASLPIQAQLLVLYDLDAQTTDMATVTVPMSVTSEIYDVRAAADTAFQASSFDTSVTFPITVPEDAWKLNKSNILVCEGGSDFPITLGDENSSYDSETGELTLNMNALTLASLNVTLVSTDAVTTFMDTVTQPEEAEAVTADEMKTWKNGALSNLDTGTFDKAVSGKAVYKYEAPVLRVNQEYIDSASKSDIEKTWLAEMQESSKYLYGPNTGDHLANDEAQLDIYTGGSFKEVVDENGMVLLTEGRQYYWQKGGGINEGFALPGYTGISAVVANRIDSGKGTSLPIDMSGIQTLTGSNYLVAAGLCSHIKAGTAIDNNTIFTDTENGTGLDKTSYVIMRPLYRDPKNQYAVVAFIGARVNTQSGCAVYKFRIQQPGSVELLKTSTEEAVTKGNASYSLEGAKYDVYGSEADARNGQNPKGTLTVTASGLSNTISLKPGSYWAKETSAPLGYDLNSEILGPVTVKEGKKEQFQAKDSPRKGTISVKKQDAETGKGLANGTYRMTLYASDKKTALKSVDITKDETVSFGTYGYGTYYVHEDSATFPYMTEELAVDANTAWHKVDLNDGQQTVTVTISDQQRRGEIILTKLNEAGEPVPGTAFSLYANQDVTSLDGTVRHKNGEKVIVNEKVPGDYTFDPSSKQTLLYTDDQGHLKVSGLYLTTGDTSFQLVEETPAAGYLLDTTPVVFTLAKDETVKVISASQSMVNLENGIDIYTYEELEGETPETPDPDDPHGGYPNTLIPNKYVGVWKEEDNLVVTPKDGNGAKGAIAVRTPSGESMYRPTLVPVTDGSATETLEDTSASSESTTPETVAQAEAASGSFTPTLKVLDGNAVSISDEDAKSLTDGKAALTLDGKTLGTLVPKSGAYQVAFPDLDTLKSMGKAPGFSGVAGWSFKAEQPTHNANATTVENTLTLTRSSKSYSYKVTYVVDADVAASQQPASTPAQGDTKADDTKTDDTKATDTKETDSQKAATTDPATKQSATTLVAEWDDTQHAWTSVDLELGVSYKVLIGSRLVATTPALASGGQTLYARYALEESEFFPKGWVDQAGLPKDDSMYVYKGFTNDTEAHVGFNRIPAGNYLISEIKPPTDESGNFTYLADRKIHTFSVDAKTGLIKDTCDISKGNHIESSATEARRKLFVIREPRTHLLIHKRSSEDGKEVVGAQLVLTNEEHVVIAEWASDGGPKQIDGLRAGTYYLSEAVTPQNYDKATTVVIKLKPISTPQTVVMYDAPIVMGVQVDKRQEIADPLDERVMENGDGKNNAQLSADRFGYYDYSVDARSTANSWADEFTVTDEPQAVLDGTARLVSIATPQAWQDYDGKMNVWYKTNKTAEGAADASGANATISDGHENVWLTQAGASGLDTDGDKRVEEFAGWKLWQADLPTMVSTTLEVADLNLPEDEYVTGVRFEYGRVEMGFTTRPTDWDRELLKNEHDDSDDILSADRMTFDSADAAADAAITTLDRLVSGFATDASRAAESVISQRTKDEEAAYQKLVAEIAEYNNSLTPDSDLPRKFIDAPEKPAYQGDDDAVTKLNAARDAAKVSIRAIFETSNTPEGKVALSEALPGLKALVSGASDDTAAIIDQKVNDLTTAIGNADADLMDAIQASLIEDLDAAVDQIIDTGLSGRIHYAPAILHMQLTEAYVADSSLTNGASAVIARNGGGAKDSDGTTQTPATETETTENPEETPEGGKEDGKTPENGEPSTTSSRDFSAYPLAAIDTDKVFQSAKPRVIEIDTNLALPDGTKTLTVESGQINTIDRVNIKGLTPGKEYVLVGEIHSRMGTSKDGFVDAGVVKNNAGQLVTSTMVFTPDSENTSVDVPFTIDVERLNAYPAVAFEELHESVNGQPGSIVLAEHKDISDADQTINLDPAEFDTVVNSAVPESVRRMFKGTPLAQTGDAVLIGGAAAIAAAGVVGIVIWRRRNRV